MIPGDMTYRELAALLRQQIGDGTLPPGQRLPSEAELTRTHGVGRELVRRAIRSLRHEGLIELVRGAGHRVRPAVEVQTLKLARGSRGRWRMPTPQERRECGIGEGVPVLVVMYGGREKVYPGDRWEFTTS